MLATRITLVPPTGFLILPDPRENLFLSFGSPFLSIWERFSPFRHCFYPSLASLGTLITTATTKIAADNAALAAADTALADRDAAVAALVAALRQEAAYVGNASGGDATKIESAGMGVRADAVPIGTLAQVLNLVLTAGDFDGSLDASWDGIKPTSSQANNTP